MLLSEVCDRPKPFLYLTSICLQVDVFRFLRPCGLLVAYLHPFAKGRLKKQIRLVFAAARSAAVCQIAVLMSLPDLQVV